MDIAYDKWQEKLLDLLKKRTDLGILANVLCVPENREFCLQLNTRRQTQPTVSSYNDYQMKSNYYCWAELHDRINLLMGNKQLCQSFRDISAKKSQTCLSFKMYNTIMTSEISGGVVFLEGMNRHEKCIAITSSYLVSILHKSSHHVFFQSFQMCFIMLQAVIMTVESLTAALIWTHMAFFTGMDSIMSCQMP